MNQLKLKEAIEGVLPGWHVTVDEAEMINVIAEPIAMSHPVYTAAGVASYPNMFYISPFHPSYQPVVSQVGAAFGRPVSIALYITGIILLAGAVDLIYALFQNVAGKSEHIH